MERILLGAENALPTHVHKLESGKLTNLDGIFGERRFLDLPPVELLRSEEGLLTLDGHHRLAQAMLHQVEINGVVLDAGEIWTPVLEKTSRPVPLTDQVVSMILGWRRIAKMVGHNTFVDLYRLSFPIDKIPGLDT